MPESYRYPPRVRLKWLAALALGVLVSLPAWLPWLGTFLVASDTPAPADAIVVLAGTSPDRLPRAGCPLHARARFRSRPRTLVDTPARSATRKRGVDEVSRVLASRRLFLGGPPLDFVCRCAQQRQHALLLVRQALGLKRAIQV